MLELELGSNAWPPLPSQTASTKQISAHSRPIWPAEDDYKNPTIVTVFTGKSSPYLMRLWEGNYLPHYEIERRAQGARRIKKAIVPSTLVRC